MAGISSISAPSCYGRDHRHHHHEAGGEELHPQKVLCDPCAVNCADMLCALSKAPLSGRDAVAQVNMHYRFFPDYAKRHPVPDNSPPVKALYGLMGDCSDPYVKELTITDLKPDQNRFHISKEFVKRSLEPLLWEEESVEVGIEVSAYDWEGKEHAPMVFKLWSKKSHVLNKGWKDFCISHGFVPDESVTLWMFRHLLTEKLCVVIVRTAKRARLAAEISSASSSPTHAAEKKKKKKQGSTEQDSLKIKRQRKEKKRDD